MKLKLRKIRKLSPAETWTSKPRSPSLLMLVGGRPGRSYYLIYANPGFNFDLIGIGGKIGPDISAKALNIFPRWGVLPPRF